MPFAKFKGEEGSAVLEFIGFGLLLQVPMVLFAGNLALLQHDQLVAEAITRDVLRSFVLFDAEPSESARESASMYGVAPSRVQISMSCRPADCKTERTWVSVKTQIGAVIAAGVIQR